MPTVGYQVKAPVRRLQRQPRQQILRGLAVPDPFPTQLLGIEVDLLVNGTWVDISTYVLFRDLIHIQDIGRPDEASTIQPGEMTLTLNNRDGRFTIGNSAGAYYPNLTMNTQIRIYISASSITGFQYTGYRYYGEVPSWPIQWDKSGTDVYVTITASGIWRRIAQSKTSIGSPFKRYYLNTVGLAGGIIGYWAMEDGSLPGQTGTFVPGLVSNPSSAMGWGPGPGSSPPTAATVSSFPGSDALPACNGIGMGGSVAAYTVSSVCVRFAMSIPSAGDSGSSNNQNLVQLFEFTMNPTGGTLYNVGLQLSTTGKVVVVGYNFSAVQLFTATSTNTYWGVPVLVSIEVTQSGGNLNWAVRFIKPGAGSIFESITGTVTTATLTNVQTFSFNGNIINGAQSQNTGFGHLAILNQIPSMTTAATALNGYIGETALTRFTRLCTELGITSETIGSSSAALGPQLDQTMSQIFQSIEDSDGGLLYESRSQFGLGYRSQSSMKNQTAGLILNYVAAHIADSIVPTFDDSLVRNDVTLVNWDNYTSESILTAGVMSIQSPPNGIGTGYQYSRNVSLQNDSDVTTLVAFLLGVWATSIERYPDIVVDMSRVSVASLFNAVPSMRIGDYLQITNPPSSFFKSSTIKQLAWGYSETIGSRQWVIDFNCVPEDPWETGYSPGTVSTTQQPGVVVNQSVVSSVTNTSGVSSNPVLAGPTSSLLSTIHGIIATTPGPWQTATLLNSWTGSGSGVNGIFYRLWADINYVEVEADIQNTTATGNSIAAQMALGYRPAISRNRPAFWNNPQANNSPTPPWIFYDTAGNIQITGIQVANHEIFFQHFIFLGSPL